MNRRDRDAREALGRNGCALALALMGAPPVWAAYARPSLFGNVAFIAIWLGAIGGTGWSWWRGRRRGGLGVLPGVACVWSWGAWAGLIMCALSRSEGVAAMFLSVLPGARYFPADSWNHRNTVIRASVAIPILMTVAWVDPTRIVHALFWVALVCTAVVAGFAGSGELHGNRLAATAATPLEAAQRSAALFHDIANQEEERRRIARDIHDQIGQLLTAAKYYVESLRERHRKGGTLSDEDFTNLNGIILQGFDKVHEIVYNLRPRLLDDLGLVPAIQWYSREFLENAGLTVQLDLGPMERIENEKEIVIFRIVQEVSTNIVRHAQATEVTVRLSSDPHQVHIVIEDNGEGFDPAAESQTLLSGFGLQSVAERVALFQGTCTIDSQKGKGTKVLISLPI